MKKFEFRERSYPLALDIAGHPFTLCVTSAVAKKLDAYGKEAVRMGETLPETVEGVEQAWLFLKNTLDDLLGSGATDTIFENREQDLMDAIDVMAYICDAIEDTAKQQSVATVSMPMPTKQQSVEQALRVMQNPEVMAAVAKAMQ